MKTPYAIDISTQEIYDQTCAHLAQQKGRSRCHLGYCRFRGQGGRKCVVGYFIPDEIYEESMERFSSARVLVHEGILSASEEKLVLLRALQDIHDNKTCATADELVNALKKVAQEREDCKLALNKLLRSGAEYTCVKSVKVLFV